jgi:hypothetical protein
MSPSKVLLSVGVACLLVGALAGFLYGVGSTPARTTTSTATVQTIADAYDEVASSYTNHLVLLDSANTSALMGGYEQNATVEWEGESGGCNGNYTGTEEIATPLMALLANDSRFLVYNETETIGAAGSHWVVKSSFNFAGNSTSFPYAGRFDGAIAAQDSYALVGHTWLIASETWNFVALYTSLITHPYPTSC